MGSSSPSDSSQGTTNAATRRHWEHSRLRRRGQRPEFTHPHGGGASLRRDSIESYEGGASLRDDDTETIQGGAPLRGAPLHRVDTETIGGVPIRGSGFQTILGAPPIGADPSAFPTPTITPGGIPYPIVCSREGVELAKKLPSIPYEVMYKYFKDGGPGAHQTGSQVNPSRNEFDPTGHVSRTSTNNVGMASDLIKLATQGKPSCGNLSIFQAQPAYDQYQKPTTIMNAGQTNQSKQQDQTRTLAEQSDTSSSSSSTVGPTPTNSTQQQKMQDPDQPRIGGSLSTGNLMYTRAPGSVDLLRGSQSSPIPGGLGSVLSPADLEGEAARAAGSSRGSSSVSTVTSDGSLGQRSTQSEPLVLGQQDSAEPTKGDNQAETTAADMVQREPQLEDRYAKAGREILEANMANRQRRADIEAAAQHQQHHGKHGSLGDTVQYPQPASILSMLQHQQQQRAQAESMAKQQHGIIGGTAQYPQPTALPYVGPMSMGPVSEEVKKQRSAMLNRLTGESGIPTIQDILDPNMIPFTELGSSGRPDTAHGVVVILNAPFNITQAEVKAFMGRSSRILNDIDEPVHIMMDRVTSKTYDVYVELMTFQDAVNAVHRHEDAVMRGRQPRLGFRHVEVKLSSQGRLMKELFPFAKGVNWDTIPPGIELNSRWSWENFDGFVSQEELTMMWKHVENPGRTPFATECKERIYECMISTLKKLPWYMCSYITIKQRQAIYDTTINMIRHLSEKVTEQPHHDRLTPQLLDRLVGAAMRCHGFTVLQKDNIAYITNLDEAKCLEFNQPHLASLWRHQWGLTMKPGIPLDVVEFYICIIREETTRAASHMGMQRRREMQALMEQTSDYWGYFWAELAYPKGPTFDNMTIAEATAREWTAIEQILRRAFCGGFVPQY
ncbi:hypothetical protein F4818DRAFT_444993 [Hypoxylon cercidicola]|nr:hypothetical protein F4818DRAFT_444993 [Hypoxylon cercidicola]